MGTPFLAGTVDVELPDTASCGEAVDAAGRAQNGNADDRRRATLVRREADVPGAAILHLGPNGTAPEVDRKTKLRSLVTPFEVPLPGRSPAGTPEVSLEVVGPAQLG